jgi:dipeptidyl aminopeptidase/acylaminoacyl peptidase
MKQILTFCLFLSATFSFAQQPPVPLTVQKIMRDQKWIGSSPSNPMWSTDGRYLFFSWNPDGAPADSLYYITLQDRTPRKATIAMRQNLPASNAIVYNGPMTAYAYTKNGDLFYVDAQKRERRITQTVEAETAPRFINNDSRVVFNRSQNIYAWDISTGTTEQLTNFIKGAAPKEPQLTAQEAWVQQQSIQMSAVLQQRKAKREATEAYNKKLRPKELRSIYTEDKTLFGIQVSPDGRFIAYRLLRQAPNAKNTVVPNYVTESGFTTDINSRTKVGAPGSTTELYLFDRERDTVLLVKPDGLPGITDAPDYAKDYPVKDTARRRPATRRISYGLPDWNDKGTAAMLVLTSADNKDRWIVLIDPVTGVLKTLDRQRDEAWIAGPGINASPIWLDDNTLIFQSEATGYSHVYKADIATGTKTPLTAGTFEVSALQLSKDKKHLYFTSNELHPGDYQFYRMSVNGGARERLTSITGINTALLSPDEKTIALLYSYSNKPWELYLQEARAGSKAQQVTNLAQSAEFRSYPWRDPEIVTFTARDGATVYARLYRPATPHASRPAVIFVHGAGYLQNVHKGWSSYSREFMFNNLLADAGYTVLDIDYRGSQGYGRDWRTGIYRYMGNKDLTDHVDGAAYLVKNLGVNPKNIGLYGGSYGGFITLMGLFTQPDVFASGAALRSVTDWAHYNHGYTANILNEPYTDSLAYKKSSPIYFAEGLKGHLLMCHGMVDVNVHFQDIIRLTQRLIELGKDNWELAVYPVEDHGFVEPSSWTDEYKRVLKLFETTLKH